MTKQIRKRRPRGAGTVFQHQDGRWYGALTLQGGGRSYATATTRAEPEQRLGDIRSSVEGTIDETEVGSVPDARFTVTLGEYLPVWLNSHAQTGLAPMTVSRYGKLCSTYLIPALGDTRLQDLSKRKVEGLLGKMLEAGVAHSTVDRVRSILSIACRAAVREDLIAQDPCSHIGLPRTRTTSAQKWLSSEDLVSLITLVRDDDLLGFCCTTALVLGLNLDEVLALRFGDFRAERALVLVERRVSRIPGQGIVEISLGPRRRPRLISLPRVAETALERQVARVSQMRLAAGATWEDHDVVCPNAVGGYLDALYIQRQFRRKASSAGFSTIRFRDVARAVRQPILVRIADCLQSAQAPIHTSLIERVAVDDR